MKRSAKSWVFFALQILFMLVVPCVFTSKPLGRINGSLVELNNRGVFIEITSKIVGLC